MFFRVGFVFFSYF